MASLLRSLFGSRSSSEEPIVGHAISHHEPRILEADEPEKVVEEKARKVAPAMRFTVNNWSRDIDLPLMEVAILGNGRDEINVAGRTHLYAAREFREYNEKVMTDSTFYTAAHFNDRFTLEVVASKEEDGAIPGIYTDLGIMAMQLEGASEGEIEEQRKINKEYQAKVRAELLSQDNVFVGRIKNISEPVKVLIDVHDPNQDIDSDHMVITAVSMRTERVVAQLVMPLK